MIITSACRRNKERVFVLPEVSNQVLEAGSFLPLKRKNSIWATLMTLVKYVGLLKTEAWST